METKITEDLNYWIIGTNKWSKSEYTKEQAERYSDTLINCQNCSDCSDCSYCSDCSSCSNCSSCRDCSDCSNCSSCRYCSSCSYCRYCSSCSSCSSCRDCSDFKTNPQRITSPSLGSRNSQTTYYWNKEKEQIVCGCFKGTLQEFENKIKETHLENDFAKGYFQWIKKVKEYLK